MARIRRDLAAMLSGRRGINVLAEPPEWMDDALCAQVDPAIFYPEDGGSTRPAKKVCAACPVLAQCRAHALANDEQWGIWGGLTESDRRKARGQARRELREAS